MTQQERTLERLLTLGFDESEVNEGEETVRVGCSQCQALAINGVACHERTCPNEKEECAECMAMIPYGHGLCESCANPDDCWEDEAYQKDDCWS